MDQTERDQDVPAVGSQHPADSVEFRSSGLSPSPHVAGPAVRYILTGTAEDRQDLMAATQAELRNWSTVATALEQAVLAVIKADRSVPGEVARQSLRSALGIVLAAYDEYCD